MNIPPLHFDQTIFDRIMQNVRLIIEDLASVKFKIDARKSVLPSVKDLHDAAKVDSCRLMCQLLDGTPSVVQKFVLPQLLIKSSKTGSVQCIKEIIERMKSLSLSFISIDMKGRTLLHLASEGNNPQTIRCLIQNGFAVNDRDLDGQSPLHISSMGGCELAVEQLITLGASIYAQDNENLTPMFYAVTRGHHRVVQVLLSHDASKVNMAVNQLNQTFLSLACRYNFPHVASVLLQYNADPNILDLDNEQPLHLSIRGDSLECVKILLTHNAEIDGHPSTTSPLLVAISEGNDSIVDQLLQSGASVCIPPSGNGLSPVSHAAFLGYLSLSKKLKEALELELKKKQKTRQYEPKNGWILSSESDVPLRAAEISNEDLVPQKMLTDGVWEKLSQQSKVINEPGISEKSFGHSYLLNHSQLRIKFGAESLKIAPVTLYGLDYLANMKIVVSPIGKVFSTPACLGSPDFEPIEISLPMKQNDERFEIFTSDVSQTGFGVDIISRFSEEVLGRAVILPGTFSEKLRSHETDHLKIPLFNSSLKCVGELCLTYLIVDPFHHEKLGEHQHMYWKSTKILPIIGHRGSGARGAVYMDGYRKTHVEENTVLSFVTAASLGAQYIEFDVQISSDGIPIIYHDWILSEFGCHIPVGSVSLQEFVSFKSPQMEQKSRDRGLSANGFSKSLETLGKVSREWHGQKSTQALALGIVDAPFATLEESFKKVPLDTGFNIEVKYPLQEELIAEKFLPQHKMNYYVDKILECVYNFASNRPIMFSSFHPDICIMLATKQPNYPVFFLTCSGVEQISSDIRCNSIKEAIIFAKHNNLLGLACQVSPLLECPDIIHAIKTSGLLLFTWGRDNNSTENVKLQLKCGVDAVILDHVAHISKTLASKTVSAKNTFL
eukprot:Sdes_comp18449_c0_seq1m8401